jgi:hypothetical protein
MVKPALYNLKSGFVLSHDLFAGLNADELSGCIATMRELPNKPVTIISNAILFFSPAHLLKLIQAKDETYKLVNEGLGEFFTEEQITALTGGVIQPQQPKAIAKAIEDGDVIVDLGQKNAVYTFAPVPQGWDVSGRMSLGPTKIKRKVTNQDGDGTLFFMAPGDYEKLWVFASKAWAGLDVPLTGKFNTGMGVKTATVQDDRISLGGNYIRRYEIEQVAKHRNWAMPIAVAVAA